MNKRILIAGAGTIGLRLGAILRREGHNVTGWVASQESAALLSRHDIKPYVADLADAASWKPLSREWDAVVFCASSSRGGVDAYRAIHRQALGHTLAHVQTPRLLYTSSTSVFGHTDGATVDESSPISPANPTSLIIAEAEQHLLRAHSGAIVARISGIYGPGRGLLYRKLMEGEATITGDPSRWLNQIHMTDTVCALRHLLLHPGPEHSLFHVSDNEPVRLHDFFRWLCESFDKPMPPAAEATSRKRALTSKRVDNTRLRSTGWEPRYPSFREGYRAVDEDLLLKDSFLQNL